MLPVMFTTVYTEFNKRGTHHGRKLSARRGNPPGVLWVICWCGTWAQKHPGALQQRRVTVTLSGFSVSARANGPETPACRNNQRADGVTSESLWYLLYILLFRLNAFGFCLLAAAWWCSKRLCCIVFAEIYRKLPEKKKKTERDGLPLLWCLIDFTF